MADWQMVSSGAMGVLALVALAGLVRRRRLRRCIAFGVYLALVAGQGLRSVLWSDTPSWRAWLMFEALARALCLGIAIEIAVRMFGSLPRSARWVRAALLLAVGGTVVLLLIDLPSPSHPDFVRSTAAEVAAFTTAQRVLPRLAYGSAWLFMMLLSVATTFGLPIDPLHRVLLDGFGPYLLVYAVTLATMPALDTNVAVVNVVQALLFLALLGLWGHAAWRHEEPAPAPPEIVQRLWPWR